MNINILEPMGWKIIDSGKKTAQGNMSFDTDLLLSLSTEPILHLYDWEKDAATYGHFIQPAHFFNMNYVEKMGFDLAKRPTGGGIVFHTADYAFSVLVPASHKHFSLNTLDNYHYVNNLVGKVVSKFMSQDVDLLIFEDPSEKGDFCMAKPTKYDLMLEGKKVGGAAQRKTKGGYLHQGSIFLGHLPDDFLFEILLDPSIREKMRLKSSPLLGNHLSLKEIQSARQEIKSIFKDVFLT